MELNLIHIVCNASLLQTLKENKTFQNTTVYVPNFIVETLVDNT